MRAETETGIAGATAIIVILEEKKERRNHNNNNNNSSRRRRRVEGPLLLAIVLIVIIIWLHLSSSRIHLYLFGLVEVETDKIMIETTYKADQRMI